MNGLKTLAIWNIKHIDKEGNILHEFERENALVNEGERVLLNAFFRGTEVPTSFYIGLCYGEYSEENQLVHIANEPTGNGYSRQLIERSIIGFSTIELHEGDYRITSKELSIEASGGSIGPVDKAFLCTSSDASGNLLSIVNFPGGSRTIASGETLTFSLKIKAM